MSTTRTPTAPTAEYVLQLPIFRNSGNGNTPDTTAAQSEALALNGHQFLILSRDGNGRGNGATRPEVFRSVILVDTNGATNLAGTSYSNSTAPVVVGGACNAVTDARGCLLPSITPVSVTQLVNIINPTQLGRFGLNTNTNPSDLFSVSEKLEGMVLLPVLEEAHPQDFFLLVGNDNDFETTNGLVNGFAFDASLSGAGGTGNNEPTILVYRLTLPTYVDAEALASMIANSPIVMASESETAFGFSETASGPAMSQLSMIRRSAMAGGDNFDDGVQVWASGQWNQVESRQSGGPPLGVDGGGIAFGVDTGLHGARIGVAAGYQKLTGDFGAGSDMGASGWGLAVYGGWISPDGFYAQASYGMMFNLDFDSIARPAAYGLTATGETSADAQIFEAEGGWRPQWGPVRFGPFINLRHAVVDIDGYTETGAALGNVTYPDRKVTRASGTVGLELDGQFGAVIPSARVAYTFMNEGAPDLATVRLASAQDAMGTQVVTVPSTAAGYYSVGLGLQGAAGPVDWRASAEARFGNGDTDVRAGIGAAFRF
ncbi:MAG: autotransporter domain-containing protein [Caulobacteraceae bacterium]